MKEGKKEGGEWWEGEILLCKTSRDWQMQGGRAVGLRKHGVSTGDMITSSPLCVSPARSANRHGPLSEPRRAYCSHRRAGCADFTAEMLHCIVSCTRSINQARINGHQLRGNQARIGRPARPQSLVWSGSGPESSHTARRARVHLRPAVHDSMGFRLVKRTPLLRDA